MSRHCLRYNIATKQESFVEKLMHLITLGVIIAILFFRILPILVMGGNYIFTIHDNMDFFPGFIRVIRDSGTFFEPNEVLGVFNGVQEKYLLTNYNFHESVCVLCGYVIGETINKVFGTILGFFSMRALLLKVFTPKASVMKDIVLLVSIVYATIPCAPTRIVPFAFIPVMALFFLYLKEKEHLCWISLVAFFFPFFLCLRSSLLFALGFWVVGIIVVMVRERKIHSNLLVSFAFMVLGSVLTNIPSLLVALTSENTNRSLILETYKDNEFWPYFLEYLHGQEHAPTLHDGVFIWFLITGTVFVLVLCAIEYKKKNLKEVIVLKQRFIMLLLGFLFWILSTALMAARVSGVTIGIRLIDSFSWGRVQAFCRIIFILMFMLIVVSLPKKKYIQLICYGIAIIQLFHVSTADCLYNDDLKTIESFIEPGKNDYISYNEFFSENLFESIKNDIDYHEEGVAAYGFHPVVLMANGFNSIDGYLDVHPMRIQDGFRRILEPAINAYPDVQSYYDKWGGRMYLFGELTYQPTKESVSENEYRLLINTEAFEDYGGKYIFSRGKISNADDLDLVFVNDYSSDESIYHIYLYETKNSNSINV